MTNIMLSLRLTLLIACLLQPTPVYCFGPPSLVTKHHHHQYQPQQQIPHQPSLPNDTPSTEHQKSSLMYQTSLLQDELRLQEERKKNRTLPATPHRSFFPMYPKSLLENRDLLKEFANLDPDSLRLSSSPSEPSGDDEDDSGIDPAWLLKVWQDMKSFYLPSAKYIDNQDCEKDTSDINIILHYKKLLRPILKMIDSWGKVPDGFFFGNIRVPGMYEECLNVEAHYNLTSLVDLHWVTTLRNYTGRYCTIYYQPVNNTLLLLQQPSERKVGSGAALVDLASPLPFSYGTCMPSTCTSDNLLESLNVTLAAHEYEVTDVYCHELDDPTDDLNGKDKAMLSILGIFGVLIVIATSYDVITLQLQQSPREVLLGFSLYTNLRKVFTYDNQSGADLITCLPALRVLTMSWIIICHQYEANFDFLANTFDSLRYQDPVISQVVTNGWLSVDTFLFMTGLVLTYRLLPFITSHRPATQLLLFCTAFLRRFFRLAPTIFCVSLFCASLLRFLAYGPRAHVLRSFSQDQCADHWWKDPLFVNNFILGENKGFNVNDCLDNCWYTAVDMQLLLILPVLLMPIAYFGFVGLVSLSLVTLLAILVPLIITIVYNLPPSPLHYIPSHTQFEYMWRVYLVPWCRAGPWLVGVWCAFLLRQPTVSRVKISKVIVVLGYVAAVSLGLILVLGLYPYNHVFPDEKYINYPTMSAVYGALARPVWGMCVGWVVFTCHTGNADMVDRILSYPGWRPLARLTFCMYLVAPVVQLWWSSVQYVPNYYNYLNKLFESAGVMFIAGVVSILLTCIIELPVNFVFDLFIPSSAKKQERMVKMVSPSKVSHDI